MEDGFSLLDDMKYSEAAIYFKTILKENPENRTAKICHARAIGLGGNPSLAKYEFVELLDVFPTDFEVQLNYAESLLWNREFSQALKYYKNLSLKHPKNFTVLLGLANSYSNLKQYQLSLETIERALAIDPNNNNALVSRKYIRLGQAAKEIQNQSYEKAHILWEENLSDFPLDLETLQAQANGYLLSNQLEQAKQVFSSMKNSIVASMGLALVFYKDGDMKNALEHAQAAYQKATSENSKLVMPATSRFIEALLWNSKFKEAETAIRELHEDAPNNPYFHTLSAQLGMYTGNFKKSMYHYEVLLQQTPNSFDGLLGMANAQWALGNLKRAQYYAQQTLDSFPNQKDALSLLEKIDLELVPKTVSKVSYSKDNGENEAQSWSINGSFSLNPKLRLEIDYTRKNTQNTLSGEEATLQQQKLTAIYQIKNRTKIAGTIGWSRTTGTSDEFGTPIGTISLETQPSPRQNLKIGYTRELQSFNAALLNERIGMNHLFLNHHITSKKGTGWYTGYMYTLQSDANKRNLLFTSLYHTLLRKPFLKSGINYQYLGFTEPRPNLYFSPSSYHSVELFSDLSIKGSSWKTTFAAAGGYQFVDEDEPNTIFRVEANVQYNLGKRLFLNVFGKYSTVASETASGFNYSELGLQLQWSLQKIKKEPSL